MSQTQIIFSSRCLHLVFYESKDLKGKSQTHQTLFSDGGTQTKERVYPYYYRAFTIELLVYPVTSSYPTHCYFVLILYSIITLILVVVEYQTTKDTLKQKVTRVFPQPFDSVTRCSLGTGQKLDRNSILTKNVNISQHFCFRFFVRFLILLLLQSLWHTVDVLDLIK